MNTRHAAIRAQQRGIEPGIDDLLDRYGREQYDGHGAVVLYFDKASIRNMGRELGPRYVSRVIGDWRNVYKVSSLDNGCTITQGHRTQRIHRR